MAKIKPEDLGKVIGEALTLYHEDVTERVDALSEQAAKDLVKRTRATAPEGKRHGVFKRKISSKQVKKSKNGSTYAWYVKSPEHRLTHLLVHGHEKKGGGRTKANPFLHNAVNQVLPEYEKQVEEALRNGK